MNKAQLLKLIRESRQHLKTATPEQKLKLLALIRESYVKIKQQNIVIEAEQTPNSDYLDEK